MLSLVAYLWWGYHLIILSCDVSLPDIFRKIPILTGRTSTYLIAFFCYFHDQKTMSVGGLPLLCVHQLLSHVQGLDSKDCSLPDSSVHGILQARILEWVAFPSPGDLPHPGIEPGSPALQVDSLPAELPGKPQKAAKDQWNLPTASSEKSPKALKAIHS